ncbi:hypothetical protein AB0878_45600 [Amycolatopsis sp. NPDC047767]|uniref:hypothetical protein n=1 Tax=Amycolatopsis sp. NPDC047767 TaxID=3156765 RepID=UPI003456C488
MTDSLDDGRTAASRRPTRTRNVAAASFAGTTIEFYDFYVYGTAAALVFPKVFFPALGATAGAVASFATFGVAFVARPVGPSCSGTSEIGWAASGPWSSRC